MERSGVKMVLVLMVASAVCMTTLAQGQPPANAFASLQEIPEFSMFVQALKGSELHVTVGNTLFTGTILVPSNLAIMNSSAALNIPADKLLGGTAQQLRRIVAYHIIPDQAYYVSGYYFPNLQDRQRLPTMLPDETLLVDRTSAPGRVLLRGHMKPNEKVFPINPDPASIAGITQGDIRAGKAVIHIIDALLMPPENASAVDIPVGKLPSQTATTGAVLPTSVLVPGSTTSAVLPSSTTGAVGAGGAVGSAAGGMVGGASVTTAQPMAGVAGKPTTVAGGAATGAAAKPSTTTQIVTPSTTTTTATTTTATTPTVADSAPIDGAPGKADGADPPQEETAGAKGAESAHDDEDL